MAFRPVFVPRYSGPSLVEERSFEFPWSPGFSPAQKKRNIIALHQEARRHGLQPILEISSKSDDKVGRRLSAFSLKIEVGSMKYTLESVYQGSKVFEHGGPFNHLFALPPRDAKRYIRGTDSGNLTGFRFVGRTYPLSPKNAFYDWLYIRSLSEHADWIGRNILYEAFTDIEFNPQKQVNCQARAFAEYMSLLRRNKLPEAAEDFDRFSLMLNPV